MNHNKFERIVGLVNFLIGEDKSANLFRDTESNNIKYISSSAQVLHIIEDELHSIQSELDEYFKSLEYK